MLMDYVKFARAKGLREKRVIGVHILKNIMVPIATVTGLELGTLIAFAVITETIFSWPGMGKLLIDSIVHLDRPVVVAKSEEHTSELQSLMRISYAVFCLKKKKKKHIHQEP